MDTYQLLDHLPHVTTMNVCRLGRHTEWAIEEDGNNLALSRKGNHDCNKKKVDIGRGIAVTLNYQQQFCEEVDLEGFCTTLNCGHSQDPASRFYGRWPTSGRILSNTSMPRNW